MRLIFLVTAFIGGNFTFAQEYKTAYLSGRQEVNRSSIIHKGETFSLSLDYQKGATNYNHAITLQKQGKDLATLKSLQLSDGKKMYGPLRPFLKSSNGKLYLLYYKTQGERQIQLLSSEVNTESLQLSEPVELHNIHPDGKNLGFYHRSVSFDDENETLMSGFHGYGPKYLYKTFFFEFSPDSSKALLVWTTGWDNQVFYSILNKEMKKIISGEQELSGEKKIALGSACIDNAGNAYLVYHYSMKKRDIAELLIIEKAGKTNVKEITIAEGEVSAVFAHSNQDDKILILTGTYKQGSDNLSGVFKQQFDPAASKFINTEKTVFPRELVEILDDEEWASNKKDYGISEGWVVEPFVLQDGTRALVGEFRRNIDGQKATFKVSGTILVARFNNNGTVFSRVPKLRVSAGTTYGDSYRIVEFKNKMIFFYSDHPSNLELEMSKKPHRYDNYSNMVFVAATVNETGDVKRKTVVDLSKEDYLAENKSMKQLSPVSYSVPFRKIKKLGGLTDDFKWVIVNIE